MNRSDDRCHFVLPHVMSNTDHSEMYAPQLRAWVRKPTPDPHLFHGATGRISSPWRRALGIHFWRGWGVGGYAPQLRQKVLVARGGGRGSHGGAKARRLGGGVEKVWVDRGTLL